MYLSFSTANWGYHRQGSCQAGLGAAISPVQYPFLLIIIYSSVGIDQLCGSA